MKRTNDFLVGATVLGIIGLVTAALIWVNQSEVGQRRHRLTARFHDVGNARVGNVAGVEGAPHTAHPSLGNEIFDDVVPQPRPRPYSHGCAPDRAQVICAALPYRGPSPVGNAPQ